MFTLNPIAKGVLASTPEPEGDPYWSNVVSLLHFEGEDGSATFTDEKGSIWSLRGYSSISSVSSRFGSSLRVDPPGEPYAAGIRRDTPVSFGSQDFALEISACFLETASFNSLMSQRYDYGQDHSFSWYFYNGSLTFEVSSDGAAVQLFSTTFQPVVGDWYDFILTRDGNSIRLGINGTEQDTYDVTGLSIYNSSQPLVIGSLNATVVGGTFDGYLDEARITVGRSRPIQSLTGPFPNTGP